MTGLDINVKFNSVSSFEFNPAISLLDILKIKIFHLWVIDSSDPLYEQIHNLTYNQLVEKIFDDADMKIREPYDCVSCHIQPEIVFAARFNP